MASNVLRKIITCQNAPKPVGPYSQAVIVDHTMYISGQVGIDPTKPGGLVEGGIVLETEQTLKNLQNILIEAGVDMGNVVKTTVLLDDIKDWPKVNEIYAKYFTSRPPARAAYQAAALPLGAKVEIEAIAVIGDIRDV